MKRTLLTILSVLFCAITFAQSVPQGINYQAVARDVNGVVLMNQNLTIQFSVISDITTSSVSWQETHTVNTNDYGLYTAIIGQGIATSVGSSATFNVIDWGASNHLLKVEVDFGGGLVDMGTTAFMSVPYSMNASNVDPTDELQSLSISGDTLFISSGNYIILPSSAPTLLGCTDSTAYSGYNPLANTDDGSCIAVALGCTDSLATNYNPLANTDDGSCIAVVNGCTDSTATNYDPLANVDDGSCTYPCLLNEVTLTLYDSYGDGGGQITVDGNVLTNSGTSNSMSICVDLSVCTDIIYASTDSWPYENSWDVVDASGAVIASGGNASGTVGNGCPVYGCTDSTATNYNAAANTDDGSCIAVVNGCTDSTATNYNPLANTDDGSCIAVVNGCTDTTATNYDPLANVDDGSCLMPPFTGAIGDTYGGGVVFWLDGNGGGLIAAPTDQSTGAEWGCHGTNITGAGGTAIGAGTQNTIDILNAGCYSSFGYPAAAGICANLTLGGYSDWFLPSKDELNEMYLNKAAIGGFANNFYWSSTEYDNLNAWIHYFFNGGQYSGSKNVTSNVRAVRAF